MSLAHDLARSTGHAPPSVAGRYLHASMAEFATAIATPASHTRSPMAGTDREAASAHQCAAADDDLTMCCSSKPVFEDSILGRSGTRSPTVAPGSARLAV